MASSSKGRTVRPNDPNFEEVVLQWFEESEASDNEIENDDVYEESEHNTESDQSEEENSNDEEINIGNYFYGKGNAYKWSSQPPVRNVRTPAHNLVRKFPGVIGKARSLGAESNIEEFWSCIFSESMLNELLLRTNDKIRSVQENYVERLKYRVQETDVVELKACLGLLYLSGAFKSGHEDVKSMFATNGTGRDIFRSTMSLERFLFLIACFRFDNSQDRTERQKQDPLAAISFMFNELVKNSQLCFTPGTDVCIDEMLVGFRGRCRFKMYLPSKPVKYGLKIMILADVKTHYFYNGYVYSGKDSDGANLDENFKKFDKPTQAVLRLAEPLFTSNRNITGDNWFSSVPLVEKLLEYGLTYVGTLKKNKKEIPKEFLAKKSRSVSTTMYGFTKHTTIISHVPKKNKAVILISSMHHSVNDTTDSGKPEIIEFYNGTKGAVDSLDQKCATYSVSRRTRRWPMALFGAIMNIAAVNSYILYYSVISNENMDRCTFIQNLAMTLVIPQLHRRLYNERLPTELRHAMSRILKVPFPSKGNDEPVAERKRKRCYICPSRLNRKTNQACCKCSKPIFSQCALRCCPNCIGQDSN